VITVDFLEFRKNHIFFQVKLRFTSNSFYIYHLFIGRFFYRW